MNHNIKRRRIDDPKMILQNLFFKTCLLKPQKQIEQKPRKHPIPISSSMSPYTPMTKQILAATSPSEHARLLEEIGKDNKSIKLLELKDDETDPDFQEKLENGGLGFYMEDFICAFGVCPFCKEKLLVKSIYANMPVIDLVCINTDSHKSRTKIFQVKISVTNKYFSKKDKFITVGSRKYGEIPNTIIPQSDDDFFIVPAYICLQLVDHDKYYTVDRNSSFVLEPIKKDVRTSYYSYINPDPIYKRNRITWNENVIMHDTTFLPVDKIYTSETIILKQIKNPCNPYDKENKPLDLENEDVELPRKVSVSVRGGRRIKYYLTTV